MSKQNRLMKSRVFLFCLDKFCEEVITPTEEKPSCAYHNNYYHFETLKWYRECSARSGRRFSNKIFTILSIPWFASIKAIDLFRDSRKVTSTEKNRKFIVLFSSSFLFTFIFLITLIDMMLFFIKRPFTTKGLHVIQNVLLYPGVNGYSFGCKSKQRLRLSCNRLAKR